MRSFLFAAVTVSLAVGCSGGNATKLSDLPPVAYDPPAIAQAALAALDRNKNGQIDGSELDACPALKSALPAIDRNKDRAVSADELQQRAERYAAAAGVPVACTVTLDGRPLTDATVTFEPEPFMGPGLKAATGKTDATGTIGSFEVDGQAFADLSPGLYRIRVTKDGTNIPARYNTQSTLGREVIIESRETQAVIELALRGK
jgi:hypothetical protein